MSRVFTVFPIFFMLFWGTGAPGQEAEKGASGDSLHMEEIIVSSQRRKEKQQEVPMSVKVIDGDLLVHMDVRTLQDLNGMVPGFVTTDSVVYNTAPLSIRGIGGSNGGGSFFSDEPVSIYMDDVYVGRLSMPTTALLDVGSIEILRGPQGTLYGRNATAGAVSIKSARPLAEYGGYARILFSDLGEIAGAGAVTGPVVPGKLNMRVAYGYREKDQWALNRVGRNFGDSRDGGLRLFLEWKPSENIGVDLIAEYSERVSHPVMFQMADLSQPLEASPYVLRPGLEDDLEKGAFAMNELSQTDSETGSLTASSKMAFPWGQLNFTAGMRNLDFSGVQDSDSSEGSWFSNDGVFENDQWSGDLTLTTAPGYRWDLMAGFSYMREDNGMPVFNIRNHAGVFGTGSEAHFQAFQEMEALGFFFDGIYHFNASWSLTLGGRFSQESKFFVSNINVTSLNGGIIPDHVPDIGGLVLEPGQILSVNPEFEDHHQWQDFSPRLVLSRQRNRGLTYFSYSQGFKSGGYNVFGQSPAFEPEKIEAFEFGVKQDFINRRFRLNGSAFFYDYTDLQVRLGVPTGGVDIVNAAAAEVMGAELETVWAPTYKLRLEGGLAWLDAEFTEGSFRQVPIHERFPIGAPIPLESVSISGNRLSRAPKWQWYFSSEYRTEAGAWGMSSLQLFWRWQDEVSFLESAQDQPTFRGAIRQELDLRLSLFPYSNKWELALFALNLTDARHITQVTQLGAFPNAAVNEPRRLGIQAIWRF